MTSRILFFCLLFFLGFVTYAQFDSRIDETSLAIAGENQKGFLTRFTISAKQLEKAWWRYCREFGRPLNIKGYYKVTIPSEVNSGNVNLNLLSKSMSSKTGSTFFLALDRNGVPAEKVNAYHHQVKQILQSFKVSFATEQLEEKLEDLEKDAKKTSKRVAKSSGNAKDRHLQELLKIEEKIEAVKEQLAAVNSAY